jgi:predicted secreted protein
MQWASALAIYFLFWFLCLFLVLPFRLRTSDEHDPHVPGQAESAPPRFSVARTAKWTTLLSAVMFGLFYVNFVNGWVTPDDLDFFTPAAERSR